MERESGRKLIAIEARIMSPEAVGGVGQVIMSLAKNLSELDNPPHDYVFVGLPNARDWLAKYVGGRCRLHIVGEAPGEMRPPFFQPLIDGFWAWRWRLTARLGSDKVIPAEQIVARSDGVVEALGAAIVHFPLQSAYLTQTPSIYHPHDLQHLHMPEFFDANTLRVRLICYRAFCHQARRVCVETGWIRDDVAGKIDVAPERIAVVPVAPPALPDIDLASDAAQSARRRAGFADFLFYPAQTWRHKNHARLLEALAILRTRHGITAPLVCSGKKNEYFAELSAKIDALGLTDQVRFIGFVSDAELSALYRLARAVIVPTRFESLSLPIWEAFSSGVAVGCSRVTSLPEQIGDAGLSFDAENPDEMAEVIKRLWTDDALRRDLIVKGRERIKALRGDRMAKDFVALYDEVLREVAADEADRAHGR